jgi:hypothetical protein
MQSVHYPCVIDITRLGKFLAPNTAELDRGLKCELDGGRARMMTKGTGPAFLCLIPTIILIRNLQQSGSHKPPRSAPPPTLDVQCPILQDW